MLDADAADLLASDLRSDEELDDVVATNEQPAQAALPNEFLGVPLRTDLMKRLVHEYLHDRRGA